jgi:CRP-like cAMP-binding protein
MMPRATANEQRNAILNALSATDFALLQPHLQSVPLPFRHRMQSANRRIRTVYFIESGLGSVVAMGGGERRQAEVAVIGREGMTGTPVVLGAKRSPCEIFMQVEDSGQCIEAEKLSGALDRSVTLARCLMRFAHVFAVQASYTALANAHGKVEERLARWLLMAQDRVDSDVLELTHEFLALMLGVRGAGVTIALRHFEAKGVVKTARGAVTIHDREGLEECADGFYGQPRGGIRTSFPRPINLQWPAHFHIVANSFCVRSGRSKAIICERPAGLL